MNQFISVLLNTSVLILIAMALAMTLQTSCPL